ncbi:DUF4239 domain-containing protein [Streptomyces sp. UG1]|uniref:bestrophin-like domain n=1 Tax=Streptomyces sp. UG1 TaxID=3417652 RepID=UPI003CFB64DE
MTKTLVTVFGAAVLAAGAVLVKHHYWPLEPDHKPREEVAEYIAMMVSVLYALVLGLSLAAVQGIQSSAGAHVQAEASAAHQILLLAEGLPPAQAERTRVGVDAYVRHVVTVEWPAMAHGTLDGGRGWDLVERLRTAMQVPDTATAAQQLTGRETLAQLSTLSRARRGREADVGASLSPVLWFGLLVGGVLTMAFIFVFGIDRSFTHVAMVMGLSALITLTALLVHHLNTPFSGLFAVDATPFMRYFPFP